MIVDRLYEAVKEKGFVCVGLDTDINKIPAHLKKEDDPIFAFKIGVNKYESQGG